MAFIHISTGELGMCYRGQLFYSCHHCLMKIFSASEPIKIASVSFKSLCDYCYKELYDAAWKYRELADDR